MCREKQRLTDVYGGGLRERGGGEGMEDSEEGGGRDRGGEEEREIERQL